MKQYDEPSGYINDWDSGPEFWPEGNVNDNAVYMTVSPLALKDMIEEEGFSDKNILYPEKKKAFVDMVKDLDENDNSVIMIVKLK